MSEERDSNATGDGQNQLQNTRAVRKNLKKRTAPSNPATVSPKPNQRKVSHAQASTSSVNPEQIPADISHAPLILKRDSQFYVEGSLAPASSPQETSRLKSSQVIKSSSITDTEYALSMHVICSSCKNKYSVSNQPYVHKCGMSICKECNSKKTVCESCRGEEHRKSNHTAILNKDLESNLSLILKFQTIDLKDGLSESISVWDDVSANIDLYSNILKNMVGTMDLELTAKESLENCISLINIYKVKDSRSIVEKIDDKDVKNFKANESKVEGSIKNLILCIDGVLYDIFDKITPMMDIHIGLRIKNFSGKNLFQSPSNNLVCYAISERKNIKYFPLQFRDSSLYVRSCVEILKFEKSLVVDYECLDHIYSRAGVFFELEYKEKTININVNLTPNSSLQARQISLLCTGEEGPCYKDGQGISTESDILLKTYKDGDLLKSEDIILNIPDNLGSKFKRVKGIVAIDRIYGKGASIRICLTNEESTPDEASSFIIGHVMDTETLNNIPTGSFKVKDCGLIFCF